jgi:uncharacterized protein YjbI with pentapeptide repeats
MTVYGAAWRTDLGGARKRAKYEDNPNMITIYTRRSLLCPIRRVLYRHDGRSFRNADLGELSLEHAQLRDLDMSQTTLAKACLDYSHFRGVRLTESNFDGASLYGAQMRYCDLSRCSFVNSRLTAAWFRHCTIDNARFVQAGLDGTHFCHTSLRHASFEGIITYIPKGWLNFYGCDLRYARFVSTHFVGNNFYRCDLRGTDFSSCVFHSDIDRARFCNVQIDEDTKWPGGRQGHIF